MDKAIRLVNNTTINFRDFPEVERGLLASLAAGIAEVPEPFDDLVTMEIASQYTPPRGIIRWA